jgi:hypothetical protein
MSHNNLLKRINSYGICFNQVHVACIIKCKRQASKQKPSHAREIEKFVHEVLDKLGYHQQYAPIGDRDGEHLNYVTRRKGEYYGDLSRTTINEIIGAIWSWLEKMGATIVFDPQAVVSFDHLEGNVKNIQAPAKPKIIAAVIPKEKPIPARVLSSMDPRDAVQAIRNPPPTVPAARRGTRTRTASRRLRESLMKY